MRMKIQFFWSNTYLKERPRILCMICPNTPHIVRHLTPRCLDAYSLCHEGCFNQNSTWWKLLMWIGSYEHQHTFLELYAIWKEVSLTNALRIKFPTFRHMAPGPARLQLGSLLKLDTGYLDAHLIPQMGHPLPPEHPCSQCYSCGTKP